MDIKKKLFWRRKIAWKWKIQMDYSPKESSKELRIYIYIYIYIDWPIDIMVSVFAKIPGDQDSIPGRIIPKTKKMVLNVS